MKSKASGKVGLRYAGVGLELAGWLLAFMYGGYRIDRWLGWSAPWGLILLTLLGFGLTMYRLYLIVRAPSDSAEPDR